MKWSVIWTIATQQRLASIWINAPDRQAVTDAANRIDSLLARSPETAGEERDPGERLVIDGPLAVLYFMEPDDHEVYVFAVWTV